ncbi:MAG: single-stranded-DNA-specific exonuclease RecJ, partial [Eubacteriales bacterium]|nr:single-stranded-DNA-specific exonuclease RecJ [Eubacteriales bacterium]
MLRFIRRETRPFDAAAQSAMRPYQGVLAELLYARGVDTAAQADAFLDPRLDELYDPLLLNDMQAALSLLAEAKEEHWRTVVYGDYDADGVCAATIATEALRRYGVDATPHVPLREEGYGLNIAAVEELAKTYQLLVTVDLGITNADEVNRAKELGMRVIVTDHHQPGLSPCPADAVVNPLLNGYPFPRLCGAGVAYKLACALLGADAAEEWLDLAALATVADIVPLLSENRVLVAHGLPRFGERPGLKALMAVAGCKVPPTSETVGYQIAPRLNAAGRIADAGESIRLLMTRDPAEAEALAKKLDAANAERKRLETEATEQAEMQAKAHDFVSNRMLFVRGEGWNAGVIGLVAGRLNRRYGVPVCALTEKDGLLHGSLRGVRGLNLAKCLQACDDLLLRYGGHEMAAGVTLAMENDAAFRQRLEQAVRTGAEEDAFLPAQEYDATLAFAKADDALVDALEKLQPFGLDNPAPVFYTEAAQLTRRRACGAQGAHLQLSLRDGDRSLDGIAFGMGPLASSLPDAVDVAYTLAREEFRGRVSIKCNVQALRPSAQAQALAAEPQSAFDTSLLRLLRDALAAFPAVPAGNEAPDAEMIKAALRACDAPEPFGTLRTAEGEEAPVAPLLEGRQGTLFVAYARDTAKRFLAVYGDRVDLARRVPADPRCFHTLLVQPQPEAITGCWKALVLLDGPLTPHAAALWRQAVPQAALFA